MAMNKDFRNANPGCSQKLFQKLKNWLNICKHSDSESTQCPSHSATPHVYCKDGPMLVLSRKVGETIQIGSDIIIKVSSLSGGRVRIGIEAPRDVPIQRGELRPFIAPVAAPLHQPTPACGDLSAQAS